MRGGVGLYGRPPVMGDTGKLQCKTLTTTKGHIYMPNRNPDPNTYTRRNTHRLPSYDYRANGAYFLTICRQDRQRVLDIPSLRSAVLETWQALPDRFPTIKLDELVIMPDHIHCILWLDGSANESPTIGRIVGAYKSLITVAWRNHHKSIGIPCNTHLWQRDYYEHVIRNETDLTLTREYIINNPLEALLQQERRYEERIKAKTPKKR